jgi:hypothetical protein
MAAGRDAGAGGHCRSNQTRSRDNVIGGRHTRHEDGDYAIQTAIDHIFDVLAQATRRTGYTTEQYKRRSLLGAVVFGVAWQQGVRQQRLRLAHRRRPSTTDQACPIDFSSRSTRLASVVEGKDR